MQKTCLIAAHDPWFIQLLKVYSEESGFWVEQAFDGQEVVQKAAKSHPAIILLQLDLPGIINGREVLRKLHQDRITQDIPVVVFSWLGSHDETVDGAIAHLSEPITYEAFQGAVKAAGFDDHAAAGHGQGILPKTGSLSRRRNIK
jgi:CheY-like chemotaxis protein